MDWYLRNDEDFFGQTSQHLNLFKETSEYDLFRPNNTVEMNQDYEIKPLDFFVEKETTKSNSKIDSPKHTDREEEFLGFSNLNQNNISDFNLNKKKVFEIKKVKRQINSVVKYNSENQISKELWDTSRNNPNYLENAASHMFVAWEKLPLHQRMKLKREKTKFLLKRRKPDSTNIQSSGSDQDEKPIESASHPTNFAEEENILIEDKTSQNSQNCQIKPILDKKEKKILRNRISAQQSRERRKREFEELQNFSQGLMEENNMLRKELEMKNKEIHWLKSQIAKVCQNCSKYFTADRDSLTTYGRGHPYLKYGLFTSFLVVVCLIGSSLWGTQSGSRMLVSDEAFDGHQRNLLILKNFTLPSAEEAIKLREDDYKNYLPKPLEGREIHLPFKQIEFNKDRENLIEVDLTEMNKNESKQYDFLKKKRNEYISKIKQRLYVEKKQKNLKKKQNLCLNNNNFFWSIQKETYDFNENPSPSEFKNNLILKSNDLTEYYHEYSNTTEKSIIPIGDMIIDNQLRENIKSLLCRNPISNFGEASLSNLLKKKIENDSNDCLYMHLLLPGSGDELDSVKPKKEKDVFYETEFDY